MKFRSRAILVACLGISLAVSISGALIFGALLLIAWGYEAARPSTRSPWRCTALDVPLLAMAAWGLVVSVAHGSASLMEALSKQSAFALFFLVVQGLTEDEVKRLACWFGYASVVAGFWGALQIATHINYIPSERTFQASSFFKGWPPIALHYLSVHDGRAVGTRSHPLTYAESFIPAFFLMLAICPVRSFFRWKGFLWTFGLVGILCGVVFAEGRGVWIALMAGGLVAMLWSWRSRFGWMLFIAAALVVGAALSASPQFKGRLMSSFSSRGGTAADQDSKKIRFSLWRGALELVRAHPVSGVGIEGVELHATDPLTKQDRIWSETHNIFLQVATERGLIGLGLLFWILIAAARLCNAAPGRWRPAFCGFFAAMIIAGFTESWMNDKEIAMLFWTGLGGAAVVARRPTEES